MLIEGADYFIRQVRFDNRANPAAVFINDDGTFDIYLNTLCSLEEQLDSLDHEYRHLVLDHFFSEAEIAAIEESADTDDLLAPLHPPVGQIACFASEAAFERWFNAVLMLKGVTIA